MKVLMVGVDQTTKGGMWSVVDNYLSDEEFIQKTQMKYIPTFVTGTGIKRLIFGVKAIVKVFLTLLVGRYSVVHAHMSERGSVYRKSIILSLARLFGCKTVLHLHGAELEVWYQASDVKVQDYVKRTLNKADKIIILGHYWEGFIQSLVRDDEKIRVVYNAVSVPEYNHYNEKAQNILFLGVVGKRKGMDDLLEAIKLLKNELEIKTRLWIYGPDFDYNIEQKIRDSDLESVVEYKGWLDKQGKIDVFSEIAVNVLPSYNEGLPMTILETMAYGIPSITTNIAAIPEAVNNDNGIILEPGDAQQLAKALIELLSNDELRKQRSNFAYTSVKEKFSLSRHLEQIYEIYCEMEV